MGNYWDDYTDIDADNDGIFLLDYVGNPSGEPLDEGDVNCDNMVNMGDVILLLNHVNDPEEYNVICCE
jgi:hypothetical protein